MPADALNDEDTKPEAPERFVTAVGLSDKSLMYFDA